MLNPAMEMSSETIDRRSRSLISPSFTRSPSFTVQTNFEKSKSRIDKIASKRAVKKKSLQWRVHCFLERRQDIPSVLYHYFEFFIICSAILLNILCTLPDKDTVFYANHSLYYLEYGMLLWLSAEYIARSLSAGCMGRYTGIKGRLKYAARIVSILDFTVILSSFFILTMNITPVFGSSPDSPLSPTTIRALRFMQITRMLHVDRRGLSWRLLSQVLITHRQELITTLYIGFLGLVFCSYFVYLAEGNAEGESVFATYADALWWAVITMTTIGYGDVIPQTTIGRIIGMFFSVFAISFFALPAGILGSGFALRVQTYQRKKNHNKQIPAAARVIQCVWRCYAAESSRMSASTVTWKAYTERRDLHRAPTPTTTQYRQPIGHLVGNVAGLFNPNVLPRVRAPTVETSTPTLNDHRTIGHDGELHHALFVAMNAPKMFSGLRRRLSTVTVPSVDEEVLAVQRITELQPVHKVAIRVLRRLQLLVALKKFEISRAPFDVRDIIEQQSSGHSKMMLRMRHTNRRIVELLGRAPVDERMALNGRVVEIERTILAMEKRLDETLLVLRDLAGSEELEVERPKTLDFHL